MARRAHRDKDVDREDELLTNASITEAGDPIGSQTERSVDSACQGHLLLLITEKLKALSLVGISFTK